MEITLDYEKDFYSWLMGNAQLLREQRFDKIDVDHIAEELESMGRSEKRELISRFAVLLAHLLMWQFRAAKRSRSWKNTIMVQRLDIIDLLEDSPSLRYQVEVKLDKVYKKAILKAEDETGIDKKHFPLRCPYSFEETLDKIFFPKKTEKI